MSTFKQILVSTDFSASAEHAVAVAIDLAKQYGASLTLVHVWDLPAYAAASDGMVMIDIVTPLQEAAHLALDDALATARKKLPEANAILRHGIVWRELLTMIEETKPDLVVVGTHGRHGLGRVLLGSVAEKIVRHSPVPVLVARESQSRAA